MDNIYKLVRLEPDYSFGPFDCGVKDLNSFLMDDAKSYSARLIAVTYILESDEQIVAFFSLSNDRIALDDSDKATWRRIKHLFPHSKHRSDYPAVKLCRLGVSTEYRNRHIGTGILDFIKKTFITDNRTGCAFITVDALPSAVEFYRSNGFEFLCPSVMPASDDETVPMYFNLGQLL